MQQDRFPYEEFRPGQKTVARLVEDTARKGSVLVVEAPTGFGKTAATIYGLVRAGVPRILYVVRTRNEIMPVVRELARFGVEYVFLYSARHMCPIARKPGQDFWENCRLLRLKGMCSYYSAVDSIDSATVLSIVREAGENSYEAVRLLARSGFCPFFALRKAVARARFIVATYPYLFDEEIFTQVFEPLGYEDFAIVVDEAHSLGEPGYIGQKTISIETIRASTREIEEYYGRESAAYNSLERLLELLEKLPPTGSRLRRLEKSVLLEIMGDPGEWKDIASEIRLAKTERALEEALHASIRVNLYALASFYEHVSRNGIGVYYSREKDRITLYGLMLDPCDIIGKPLNKARSVILQSGTMPPLDYMKKALCLQREAREYRVHAAAESTGRGGKSTGKRYYSIVASFLTSKYEYRSSEIYQLYAEAIRVVYEEVERSVLAVYPSYDFMRSVAEYLDIEFLYEEPATRADDILEVLRENPHTVVNAVAGGKLVEGIEFLDREGRSLIGAVFLAGVPYPQPDDYLLDYIEKVTGSNDSFRAMSVMAAIRARQALGRAIRGADDKAIYVLGDRRFLSRHMRMLLEIDYDYLSRSLESLRRAVAMAKKKMGC